MTAFTADSATLRAAVGKVARVVADRPSSPVLRGILITAADGVVELLATDEKHTHRLTIPAQVTAPGRVLVRADMLARIARNLPAGQVAAELDRWRLALSIGRLSYRLETMPQEDYPADLPAAADLSKVRAAGPDEHERSLVPATLPAEVRRGWKPSRSRVLYDPQGMKPGAAITWFRKANDEYVAVSGQVWSGAPTARAVWALAEGERRPSLVVEHTYGDHQFEEMKPHWVAFPNTIIGTERTAA